MTRIPPAAMILLALAGCGSDPRPAVPFREVASETGLLFHHIAGAAGSYYIIEQVGAGGALIDYDNDGDLDVYLVQGDRIEQTTAMADLRFPPAPGAPLGNRLFRNDLSNGVLSFTDVTSRAGLERRMIGMGAAVGDFDDDGWEDLLVTGYGSLVLYRNNNGSFTDVTAKAGLRDTTWTASASWFDYNRDGRLDLFVTRYLDFSPRIHQRCTGPAGYPEYCSPVTYKPLKGALYRNDGNGRFADVSAAAGIETASGNGLGVVAGDFNQDSWPDVFVACDMTPNHLWINQRDGTFLDKAVESGVAFNGDGAVEAGMGIALGDPDLDSDEDILVTHTSNQRATLWTGDGSGQFSDVTAEFGLAHATSAYTGWGTGWFDYDHDGLPDLFIANGAIATIESLRGSKYPYHQKNLLFHGQHGKPTLADVSQGSGPALQLSEGSRGAAFGDIDNDGDIDILVTNNDGPARLMLNQTRNHASPASRWIGFRLRASGGNRDALGALVKLYRSGQPALIRRVRRDGSYLSSSDVRVHFGLGRSRVSHVEVTWPRGSVEVFRELRAGAYNTLRIGAGEQR